MEELKKFVKEKPVLVWCGLGALMLIFAAFCPELKLNAASESESASESFNGLKVLTDATGLGFPRFLLFLMILAPVCLILVNFVKISALEAKKDKLPLILCGVAFVLGLLYMLTLGDKVELPNPLNPESKIELKVAAAVGTYLYLALSLAGAAVAYLTNKK